MQKQTTSTKLALLALLATLLAGCGNKEPPEPPGEITNVTVARVAQKDLLVTESAVGTETALGVALDYDPTRVSGRTYYIRLPFPEHVASRLKISQAVTLTSFSGNKTAQGHIREIRPPLNTTTLSRDVIVAVMDSGWRPEGSIRGEIVLGTRQQALVVPEQAVVLRRAGTVVYVVVGDAVKEHVVKTGVAREGVIEILEGVQADATVVVDGAALLSDNAKIKVREVAPMSRRGRYDSLSSCGIRTSPCITGPAQRAGMRREQAGPRSGDATARGAAATGPLVATHVLYAHSPGDPKGASRRPRDISVNLRALGGGNVTLPEFSIKRHVFTLMVSLVLILFGVIGLQRLGLDKFPKVEFPVISIVTTMPGADPDIIDRNITDRVEEVANQVPGVKSITSSSSLGASVVNIEFELEKMSTSPTRRPRPRSTASSRICRKRPIRRLCARSRSAPPRSCGWH